MTKTKTDTKAFRAFAKRVKFDCVERDDHNHSAVFEIQLHGDSGARQVVGMIEKSTVWCGDRYSADSYELTIELLDLPDGLSVGWAYEHTFDVANAWGRKPQSYDNGRLALGACKKHAKTFLFNLHNTIEGGI